MDTEPRPPEGHTMTIVKDTEAHRHVDHILMTATVHHHHHHHHLIAQPAAATGGYMMTAALETVVDSVLRMVQAHGSERMMDAAAEGRGGKEAVDMLVEMGRRTGDELFKDGTQYNVTWTTVLGCKGSQRAADHPGSASFTYGDQQRFYYGLYHVVHCKEVHAARSGAALLAGGAVLRYCSILRMFGRS